MDNCIVCLETNADTFSRISTQSSEWNEGNIQRIVEKHLWWWHLRKPYNDDCNQWICRQCWQEIASFHNFYNKVEKEHIKQQYDIKLVIVKSPKEEVEPMLVKEECKEFAATLIEGMMMTLKKTEKIVINELPVAQVKNENELILTIEDQMEQTKDECDKEEYEIDGIMNTESLDDIWEPDLNSNDSNDVKDVNILADTENIFDNINETPQPTQRELKLKTARKLPDDVIAKKAETSRENDQFLKEQKFEFLCCICNAALTDFQILKSHYRNKHNIVGYVLCCNRKWYKRGLLVDHIRAHQDPNYFKCPHCEKILANRQNFDNHLKYKKFRRPQELKEHVSTHTGEPLYNCPYCPRTFISSGNLHKHRKFSHGKEWEETILKKLESQQTKAIKIQEYLNTSCANKSESSLQHNLTVTESLTLTTVNTLNF